MTIGTAPAPIVHKLSNGLSVYYIAEPACPFTAVVLAYGVGAAHEKPEEAGLAHLLEHLLFEDEQIGYDRKIQATGGITNAYTGQDYTVYYAKVLSNVTSLALKLEAERLYRLNIDSKKVETQRRVVAEEFRQRYLNPPYADRFFHLASLAFAGHPYAVPVIGRSPEEILAMPEVALRRFYEAYYAPQHAILVIAGKADLDEIERYFSEAKSGADLPEVSSTENLPWPQDALLVQEGAFPQKAVIWAYRLPQLGDESLPALDLLDDYLGGGPESYLIQRLVYEEGWASRLHSYVWAMHAGTLWVIEGYLAPKVEIAAFEERLDNALREALEQDLGAVLMHYRPMRYLDMYSERETALGKALTLTHAVLAGHIEWYLEPMTPYEALTETNLTMVAEKYLRPKRRVRVHYKP